LTVNIDEKQDRTPIIRVSPETVSEIFSLTPADLDFHSEQYPHTVTIWCPRTKIYSVHLDILSNQEVIDNKVVNYAFRIPVKLRITSEGVEFVYSGQIFAGQPQLDVWWDAWYDSNKTVEDLIGSIPSHYVLSGKRRNSRPPTAVSSLQFIQTASSSAYYHARDLIARGQLSQSNGETWPTGQIKEKDFTADVKIGPDPAKADYLAEDEIAEWQIKAASYAQTMDDDAADVLDYITLQVIERAKDKDQDVTFNADGFYELRGIQKHKAGNGCRGGYDNKLRDNFAREVEKLANTWVHVDEMVVIELDEKGKRRRSKKRGLESPAIIISARAGHMNNSKHIGSDAYKGRLGSLFAESIFGVARQTACISEKAIGYDSYRKKPEKRLTRYLSWQWRIRQGSGNYSQPYKVSCLLDAIRVEIDPKHPTCTRDRLEKALDTLQADNVVSTWQYGKGCDENIVGTKGWAERWKEWLVILEPPQDIIAHYSAIPKRKPKNAKAQPVTSDDIAERMRDAIDSLDWTNLQAAKDIGIHHTTLSRALNGETLTPATLKKINGWLDKQLSQDTIM